jgi:hypothetical protein
MFLDVFAQSNASQCPSALTGFLGFVCMTPNIAHSMKPSKWPPLTSYTTSFLVPSRFLPLSHSLPLFLSLSVYFSLIFFSFSSHVTVEFAREFLHLLQVKDPLSISLPREMHQRGINLRYLGRLHNCLFSRESTTSFFTFLHVFSSFLSFSLEFVFSL